MSQELNDLSIEQLEALSFELTAQRQAIRQQAIAVQKMLGQKNEQLRVNKLLGREVTIIEPTSIEPAKRTKP